MKFPMMLTHHRHHAICIYADVEKEGRELFKYREVARGAEFVYGCLQLYTETHVQLPCTYINSSSSVTLGSEKLMSTRVNQKFSNVK